MATQSRSRWFLLAAVLIVAVVADFPVSAQFGGKFKADPNAPPNEKKAGPPAKSKVATSNTPALPGFGGMPRGRAIPLTYGPNVAAVMSPDKNRISAYSVERGEWKSQSVEFTEDQKASPRMTVGGDLVALQGDGHVYAFSAETAQWAVLDVPKDKPVSVSHYSEYIAAEHGDTIAFFSAMSGKWAALNWKTGEVPAK